MNKKNVKVVILAGGMGTRLREETEFRPKPMVNIGPRPILWHIMKIYSHYGFNDFIICLGYRGEMIKHYFYDYHVLNNDFTVRLDNTNNIEVHSNKGEAEWKVTLVDTGQSALKGARMKKVEKYIDNDTFMLTYGDNVSSVNIDELFRFHHQHKKLATLTGIPLRSRFGELKTQGDLVTGFTEKPIDPDRLINGGYFVLNRKVFDYLTEDDDCEWEIGPLEEIAANEQLMVYRHKGFWECMDTLRDTQYLNSLWNTGKAEWKVW